jgi:hypothetical protein
MIRSLIVLSAVICVAVAVPVRAQPKKARPASKARPPKAAASDQQASTAELGTPIDVVNPGVFLLRDPLVQTELQLTPKQKTAAAALAAEFNESIWRFRDASVDSEVARNEARSLNAQIEPKLDELLSSGQLARLDGIVLQVQGTDALALSSTVRKLAMTGEQQKRISKLSADAQAAIKDVRTQSVGSQNLPQLTRQVEKLQTDLQRDLLAVLTKAQRERLIELRGAAIALSKLQPLTAQAPELRGVNDWINSVPFALKDLRGKVVALHFWTFG